MDFTVVAAAVSLALLCMQTTAPRIRPAALLRYVEGSVTDALITALAIVSVERPQGGARTLSS